MNLELVDEFVELPVTPEKYQRSRTVHLESTDTDEDQLESLVQEYSPAGRVGHHRGVQHHIQLKPDSKRQPPRRLPLVPIKHQLKQMLGDGIIKQSTSAWASPLVIVKKPSGDLRICVNYRRVND